MGYLSGWGYRRSVQINNSGPALYDHQVLITLETASRVSAGKMQPDGRDIRFTDSDGVTLLNYWIESGINTNSTMIWVKIPSIPTGSKTIYVYYGNASAVPVSNGAATFIFYDDFSSNTWFGDDTYLHIANNKVNFGSVMNGGVDAYKYKPYSKVSDLVVYFSTRINPGAYRGGIGIGFGDTRGRFITGGYPVTTLPNAAFTRITQDVWSIPVAILNGNGSLQSPNVPSISGNQYWYKSVYSGSNLTLYVFSDAGRTSQVGVATRTSAPTMGLNYLLITNTSEATDNYPGDNSYLTSLFMTKYAQFEPSISVGAEVSATVTFITNPSGARITLDGLDTGTNTPASIDVPVAGHTFELRLDCYESVSGEFTGEPGQTVTIEKTLKKNTGDLYINSSPQGADIWIDGTQQIIPTPASLPCILEGMHDYYLTKTGYQYFKGSVNVIASQTAGIDAVLVPTQAPGFGSLYANSSPQGAKIFIDGSDTGVITPGATTSIPVGTHTVRMRKYGYVDYTTTIIIEDNTTSVLEAVLIPITARGSINFTSVPSGAQIFLDGADQGIMTPVTITDVPVGEHGYALRLASYNDFTGTVLVEENQIAQVSATLIPAEGCIYFNTTPAGARIFIDDLEQVGITTPALICGIPLGAHTYRLVLEGHFDSTGTVTLGSGQGEKVSVTMTTISKPGMGAGPILALGLLGAGILGAVVYASRDNKPPTAREYLKYPPASR